jgi:ribosomal protein S18 acetylase RimI-like enzyme
MDGQAAAKLTCSLAMNLLDNPIWEALRTAQAGFARACKSARKFPPDVSVLAGFPEPTPENYESLASLLNPGEPVGLFLIAPPDLPAAWSVVNTGPLLQMLYDSPPSRGFRERGLPSDAVSPGPPDFVSLTQADVPEMLALTELTKPGPFGTRTREMGDYFGIRNGKALAAMAGERLRLPGYTEISAVCTHPDYLGRGYAKALLKMLMERICNRGELPFLHVRSTNLRAIQVYEHVGFRKRASFHYVYCGHRSGPNSFRAA